MSDVTDKVEKAAKTARKEAAAATYASFEVPTAMRDFAERGVKQAKEAYDSCRAIAEETTDAMEDTFSTVSKGATEFQTKALHAAKANVEASFDFAEKILGARSFAEAIELQTQFARRQFEQLSEQTKEFHDLVAKVQAESSKPLKDGMAKAMTHWKQAG